MNATQLGYYVNWLGKSAEQILFCVLAVGGWKNVFPNKVPRWASKVRNYFNVLPTALKRLPAKNARDLLERADRGLNLPFLLECHDVQSYNRTYRDRTLDANGRLKPPPFREPASCPAKASHATKHTGIKEVIVQENALSKNVYTDERNRPWYQMSAGSTIHHWGRSPVASPIDAFYVDKIRGQNDTPVFKLVCPDGTGGSKEVLLFNDGTNAYAFGAGSEYFGEENKCVDIRKIIVHDPAYQGSYNYSETAQSGYGAHDQRDVVPHVRGARFYVNPKDMFSPLAMRKFEPNDLDGNPLATQV